MTAEMGRFVLVEPEPRGAADGGVCSLNCGGCKTGVLYDGVLYDGVSILTLSPDLVISIRSSSSLLANPFGFLGVSAFVCSSHLPSGCMVTWPTDRDVFLRISFTYLADRQWCKDGRVS
jgi:hypothetical protein